MLICLPASLCRPPLSLACRCPKLVRTAYHINHLSTVPATVGTMQCVEAATWHRNGLTSLPPEIGLLVNLRELALFHNALETLPDTIGALVQLTELWLFDNKLHSVPSTLGHLAALQYDSLSCANVCRVCGCTVAVDSADSRLHMLLLLSLSAGVRCSWFHGLRVDSVRVTPP